MHLVLIGQRRAAAVEAAVGLGQLRTSKAYDEMPRLPGSALSAEDIAGLNWLAIYTPLPQSGAVGRWVPGAASLCRCCSLL